MPQFMEGDLYTALNAKNVPPKHPAVIYPGSRGRQIEREFREWLIKCHEVSLYDAMFDSAPLKWGLEIAWKNGCGW